MEKEFLFDNIGVGEKVYKQIKKHCLDMEYNTSGFNYDICGAYDNIDNVLSFMIKHDMIKPSDLFDLDKESVIDFIENLSFNESQSIYEFVNVDNVFYILKI